MISKRYNVPAFFQFGTLGTLGGGIDSQIKSCYKHVVFVAKLKVIRFLMVLWQISPRIGKSRSLKVRLHWKKSQRYSARRPQRQL